MAITGFLEDIKPLRLAGWVYEGAKPDQPVVVELICRGTRLARTFANIYRKDLETAKIGRGDHAFVFNLETPLPPEDLFEIKVAALGGDGEPVFLERFVPVEPPAPAALQQVVFGGSAHDPSHRPVFIVGSARSGTSAIWARRRGIFSIFWPRCVCMLNNSTFRRAMNMLAAATPWLRMCRKNTCRICWRMA